MAPRLELSKLRPQPCRVSSAVIFLDGADRSAFSCECGDLVTSSPSHPPSRGLVVSSVRP